ncbi:MAG: pyruvate dehydrogenase (acetyl-transferring) E1 component subunit alpha [Chloroflexi bacterium]|nr:pyruvate dehydrogenase (acetyl-transferring) E1 component subunit alpha [Chloroflexota bacterium]
MEKSDYLRLYKQMVLIRRIEEKCAELYQQGKIGGFLHLYIGQEAVGVGAVAAMKQQDHIITAYRDHGIALAVGMEAGVVMAELLGKATGSSGGKGGSMHLADVSKHFWGGHAIVGAHLPLATGLALSFQYQHNDSVIICMMGDGATNIGYFHESLNLSKVWKLPIVWMVENNQYGMGTAVERASAVGEIRQKALGYDMANARVDGMDLLAMKEATAAALEHARSGKGPFLLEAMTYRFRGHSMGDPERYRKPDEIKKWQEDDPIGQYHDHLTKKKIATAKELDAMEAQVEEETAAAVRFAEESPNPAPEALWENIYA